MHSIRRLTILIVLIMIYKINGAEYMCSEEVINNRQNYYSQALIKCTILNVNSDVISNFSMRSSNSRSYIRQLNFRNSTFAYLPRGIFSYIPNLNMLNITDCGLREIARYDFEHGAALTDLNAARNNLTEIKESAFFGADNLQRIDLSSNRIATINSGALVNLKQMVKIDLARNQIKVLPDKLFANLLKLTTIDLSRNILEMISGNDLFLKLKLSELNLNNNNIYFIEGSVLSHVDTIKQLNINYNRVTNLTLAGDVNIENLSIIGNGLVTLHVTNKVREVHAEHNKIKNHNLRIDDKDTHLTTLSLLNNSMTTIEFVKNLTNLTYLDVSFNPLANDSMPGDTFKKLTGLKTLYMESVNLKQIEFPLFSEQRNLELLDISYNGFNTIDFHKLSFLENLNRLYLNGNNLTNITVEDFDFFFPKLQIIDISDNNWLCDDLKSTMKHLKRLNIEIYLNGDRIEKIEKNIRGIRCYDGEHTVTPKIPIIHQEYDRSANNNYEYITQINQTQTQLNALREENENLRKELSDVIQNLDKLTNETDLIRANNNINNATFELNSNQTIEQLNNYLKQMTMEIERVDQKIVGVQNDFVAIKTEIRESKPNTDKLVERDNPQLDDGLNDDIKFIKTGLVVVLLLVVAAGIVFVALKIHRKYLVRPLRRPYSYHSTNTVESTMHENSI